MKISGFYFLKNTGRIGACTAAGVSKGSRTIRGEEAQIGIPDYGYGTAHDSSNDNMIKQIAG